MENLGIYIHIPFCNSKCNYCDFVSFTNCNDKIGIYIESLINEIDLYKGIVDKYIVDTVFIGGGTPSSIPEIYIEKVLEKIYTVFNLRQDCEISIEVNPGTLNHKKAIKYKELGINRVSMGLQSSNNNLLNLLGRRHSIEEFNDSFKILRENRFDNINVDLIFGVPNQTLVDLERDLEYLIGLNVEHIALYSLIIEENTRLYHLYMENKIRPVKEDLEREMYHRGIEVLEKEGYIHYEISNFSKYGFQSKHNLKYWKLSPYLGLGLNSHSYFEGKRFFNTENLDDYIEVLTNNRIPRKEYENQTQEMDISDFCIFGLRLTGGINTLEFEEMFGKNIYDLFAPSIEKHLKNGLIDVEKNHIKLSKRGLDLANSVEIDFLL